MLQTLPTTRSKPARSLFTLALLTVLSSSLPAQNRPPNPNQPSDDPESAWLAPQPPLFAPFPGQDPVGPPPASVPTRGPVRISGGVMAGQCLTKVNPVYPAEARAQGMEGTVVLTATIGKDGTVGDLRAVSGPPTLVTAAIEAVRQWTYKPYVLNGNPVQVMTTINVNFKLNGQVPVPGSSN